MGELCAERVKVVRGEMMRQGCEFRVDGRQDVEIQLRTYQLRVVGVEFGRKLRRAECS